MKPITDYLRDYRSGALVDEMSEEFQAVVRSVLETGKKASFKIELTIEPNKNDTSLLFIGAAFSGKPARAEVPQAIFYADSTGDLHRHDPKQSDIFRSADDEVERRVFHNAPKG